MATFLKSPLSPSPLHTLSSHRSTAKNHEASLYGGTGLDSLKGAEMYLTTADSTPSSGDSNLPLKSGRSSFASTTTSPSRHSNHNLINMLQNIQAELTTHRSILFDIQSRISHLELVSPIARKLAGSNSTRNARKLRHAPTQRKSKVTQESQTWWESCQNFAHNCDTPFNANEFLNTPRRLSGFDFNFDTLKAKPATPPITPEMDDVPSLTPTSDRDSQSDAGSQEGFKPTFNNARVPTTSPTLRNDEDGSDIVERVVEFNKIKIPMPPLLQSPPRSLRSLRSKTASILTPEEGFTALPQLPPALPPPPAAPAPAAAPAASNPQRYSKGLRSLFTYKGLLKSKKSEKNRQFLIPLHRRADLPKRIVHA